MTIGRKVWVKKVPPTRAAPVVARDNHNNDYATKPSRAVRIMLEERE